MADRSSNRVVTFTEPISGLPAINVGTGAPQLFGEISQAFAGLASTSAQRLALQRVEKARLEGIIAAESDNPQLRKDARTVRDLSFNESLRRALSQKLTNKVTESLIELETRFPDDAEAFEEEAGLLIAGATQELATAVPTLAPAFERRIQSVKFLTKNRITAKEQAKIDRQRVVDVNDAGDGIIRYSSAFALELADLGPAGNEARDTLVSKLGEFVDDLKTTANAAGTGNLFTPQQIDTAIAAVFERSALEVFFGAAEASFLVPGGPEKLRKEVIEGKFTVMFHDTSSGEFSIVKVPISQVLGNKTRVELINHLTALANRQKQGKTEAEQVLLYGMNQRMAANILLRASGEPTEDITDAEMEATGVSVAGRLTYSDDFERAGMNHEMSVVTSTGDFDALTDAGNEIRERINAADTVVAADAVVRDRIFNALVAERNKAITADSRAWIDQASGVVQAVMNPPGGLEKSEVPFHARLEVVRKEFERHGVPEQDRRYINIDDAQDAVRRHNQLENNTDRLTFLKGLGESFGPFRGSMFRNLVKEGLPDYAVAAVDPLNITTGLRIYEVNSISDADLKQRLETGVAQSILDQVNTKTGDFDLWANALPPFNLDVEARMRKQLLKFAYFHAETGDDIKESVKKGYQELLGGEWEVIGTAMVPRAQITDSLRRALERPGLIIAAIEDRIDVVETFPDPELINKKGELDELVKERYMVSLRFAPEPRINEANDGINIWLEGIKVRDAQGTPISLTWEEVDALGSTKAARQVLIPTRSGPLLVNR